jgi:DNA polymerase I
MRWEELRSFPYVWVLDFEFFQPNGERPRMHCMVAKDVHSGREIHLRSGQFLPVPPFDTQHDLFVAYAARAEMSCFAALGWPIPEYILDLNVEFRLATNDGKFRRRRLYDALEFYHQDTQGATEKHDMQQLAAENASLSPEQMTDMVAYCASDVYATIRLLRAMAATIDLPYSLVRGRFCGCVGRIEHVGIPVDTDLLAALHERWGSIRQLFIDRIQNQYDLYEDRVLKRYKFAQFIAETGIPYWPRTATGEYRRDQDTLRDMAMIYPVIQQLRESLDMLGQLRTLGIVAGSDGRSRTPLWPFGTKTGRCAPSTATFVFNLPAWLRTLIRPEPGHALAYVDVRQEEPAIAAYWSRDGAMTKGYCVGGDLYVNFAQLAGDIPVGSILSTLSAKDRQRYKALRDVYKICLLASMYGQQEYSLASRLGRSPAHARQLLRRLRMVYPRFVAWIDNEIDVALASGYMKSRLRWTLKVHPDTRETSLLNYPMQVTGSEIMQRAVYLAQQAGVEVCCPVHDALLIHAKSEDIAHHAWLTKEAWRKASEDLLSGFSLYADGWEERDAVHYPRHYIDKRGISVWQVVGPVLGAIGGDIVSEMVDRG